MDKQFKVEKAILIYAMRYALGRMTFAPTTVIDNIKYNIDLFSVGSLKQIVKDIDEQASFGYGMDCDKETWMNFKGYLKNRILELKK